MPARSSTPSNLASAGAPVEGRQADRTTAVTDALVRRMTRSVIPTAQGRFDLYLYRGLADGKDHLALVLGDVAACRDVLVRVQSECLTGEVFGSTRCDCQQQLGQAMRLVATAGAGVVVYLRQEGRGIGLLDKLLAYNLQDLGCDTVDANILLGHEADEREYAVAGAILRDLGVGSVRLLTNNPLKLSGLEAVGFPRPVRVPLVPRPTPDNARYLETKATRLGHLLDGPPDSTAGVGEAVALQPEDLEPARASRPPFVTLTYAQSLDGSIAARRGARMALSSDQSLVMTHTLRANHDVIVVGIETVLADDPRLTVRLVEGRSPIPIVLDSHLRMPVSARLLRERRRTPWLATTESAPVSRQRELEAAGAHVVRLPADDHGRVDLSALLPRLAVEGIESVMVEGGARVITSFLAGHLAHRLVLTIAPLFVGGLNAVESLARANGNGNGLPALRNLRSRMFGPDLVLFGDLGTGDGA